MGRIVVTEFVSLDGVMEAPGGGEDFRHGGWTFEIDRGENGDRFKLDELFEAEAQLLGRVTYEGFASAWPTMTDEVGFSEKMNAMPKYVVSSTLKEADWNNSTILSGDLTEEVTKLKQDVAGSAQLVRGLVAHDLLGTGKCLFGKAGDKKPLRLVGSKTVGAGVEILTYEPA
ncbi:MAG: dihydrofolate reductase family protein [Solirubrobacterales bacterium]